MPVPASPPSDPRTRLAVDTIKVSTRIYRLLLKLYPNGFRNAYGRQMVAVFEQQRRERRYRAAAVGPLIFWFDILTDLSLSAAPPPPLAPVSTRTLPEKKRNAHGHPHTGFQVRRCAVYARTRA